MLPLFFADEACNVLSAGDVEVAANIPSRKFSAGQHSRDHVVSYTDQATRNCLILIPLGVTMSENVLEHVVAYTDKATINCTILITYPAHIRFSSAAP